MVSPLAILTLEAVEQLAMELRRLEHELRVIGASTLDARSSAIRSTFGRAFGALVRIREQTLAPSGDVTSRAVRASALRARSVVLSVVVPEFERVTNGVTALPYGRFGDVAAFTGYLLGEIGRINARWIEAGKRDAAAGIVDEPTILDRVESGYAALGGDRDVASVLAWGRSHVRPGVWIVSQTIAALLDIDTSGDENLAVTTPSLARQLAGRDVTMSGCIEATREDDDAPQR